MAVYPALFLVKQNYFYSLTEVCNWQLFWVSKVPQSATHLLMSILPRRGLGKIKDKRSHTFLLVLQPFFTTASTFFYLSDQLIGPPDLQLVDGGVHSGLPQRQHHRRLQVGSRRDAAE